MLFQNCLTKITSIPGLTFLLPACENDENSDAGRVANDFWIALIFRNVLDAFGPNEIILEVRFPNCVNEKFMRRRRVEKIFFSPFGQPIAKPKPILNVQWLSYHTKWLRAFTLPIMTDRHVA